MKREIVIKEIISLNKFLFSINLATGVDGNILTFEVYNKETSRITLSKMYLDLSDLDRVFSNIETEVLFNNNIIDTHKAIILPYVYLTNLCLEALL
ncbi:MAG: hypothetical protein ACRC92_08035 [Peptostreptococcaceae bacterium]